MFDRQYTGRQHPAEENRAAVLKRSSGRRVSKSQQVWSEATIAQSEFRQEYINEEAHGVNSLQKSGQRTFSRQQRTQSGMLARIQLDTDSKIFSFIEKKVAVAMGGFLAFSAMMVFGDFPVTNINMIMVTGFTGCIVYFARGATKRATR